MEMENGLDEMEESENCMENLFCEQNLDLDVFCFEDISVSSLDENTVISYKFSYRRKCIVPSKLYIKGSILYVNPIAIFSIGMCILPWYWMCYGCSRIIINVNICGLSKDIIDFWQNLYSNVLLEYVYCNKLAHIPIIELSSYSLNDQKQNTMGKLSSIIEEKRILIPLGGKTILFI